MNQHDKKEFEELRHFQAELWGLLCPDAGPQNRAAIIKEVERLISATKPLVGVSDKCWLGSAIND